MQDPRFEALRSRLAADLRPVEPLRPGRRLILIVLPLVLAGLAILLHRYGLRPDHRVIGATGLWGLSALELALALGLATLALRETLPARSVGLTRLAAATALAVSAHGLIAWITFARSPMRVPAGMAWSKGLQCLGFELVLGLPVLLVALYLARRGLPVRPRRTALIAGIAAGLAADAVWRLVCPFSTPAHVFPFHTSGPMMLATLGGAAALAWLWSQKRALRSRPS